MSGLLYVFDYNNLAVFFSVSIMLALAPGPDNIFVLTLSMLRGALAGFLVTLGLCTGLLVHTTAVALGVAAIFGHSALAFTLLKLAGAAYLLYLSWQSFVTAKDELTAREKPHLSARGLYQRGIVMNITNPKVSVFFLAFLPQFANPDKGGLTLQLMILGGLFLVAALLVFSLIGVLAGRIGRWFSTSETAQKTLHQLAGVVFAGLAIKLAFTER